MADFADARTRMVDTQLRTQGITDHDLLRVMGEVPRERFVPAKARPFAYSDDDIPVKESREHGGRHLLRPATLARLIQAAEVNPGDSVLDVGCATGYSSAILADLATSVVALESDQELAAMAAETLTGLGIGNVAVVTGPLEAGYPSPGPYDVIIFGGSVETVPEALFEQLKEGGRLAAIVGHNRAAPAMVYTKTDNDIGERPVFDAYAPPIPGFRRPMAFVF